MTYNVHLDVVLLGQLYLMTMTLYLNELKICEMLTFYM